MSASVQSTTRPSAVAALALVAAYVIAGPAVGTLVIAVGIEWLITGARAAGLVPQTTGNWLTLGYTVGLVPALVAGLFAIYWRVREGRRISLVAAITCGALASAALGALLGTLPGAVVCAVAGGVSSAVVRLVFASLHDLGAPRHG